MTSETKQHNGCTIEQTTNVWREVNGKWKLFAEELEIYGITDKCCKDNDNLTYSENNEYLQCKVCQRLFKWSIKRTEIRWFKRHVFELECIFSFGLAGLIMAFVAGWIHW